jgi:hypothetical protein
VIRCGVEPRHAIYRISTEQRLRSARGLAQRCFVFAGVGPAIGTRGCEHNDFD